jgi:hypothetical protein
VAPRLALEDLDEHPADRLALAPDHRCRRSVEDRRRVGGRDRHAEPAGLALFDLQALAMRRPVSTKTETSWSPMARQRRRGKRQSTPPEMPLLLSPPARAARWPSEYEAITQSPVLQARYRKLRSWRHRPRCARPRMELDGVDAARRIFHADDVGVGVRAVATKPGGGWVT